MTATKTDCEMLSLARKLHAQKAIWLTKLQETGLLEAKSYDEMIRLRQEMHKAPPETLQDCVLLAGAIRSLANFGYIITDGETELDPEMTGTAYRLLAELTHAVMMLTIGLENLAGISLDDLGLFGEGVTVQ